MVNKEDIKYEKIKRTDAIVFIAPTKKLNISEFSALGKYIDEGKTVILMASEGGELKLGTNFNHLLEQYGIFVNDDAVIRTSYFKYFNPKEVFIQNGVVDEEFIRVANDKPKKAAGRQKKRLAYALENDLDEDNPDSALGGFHFVYPFGCTMMVDSPAIKILTSGPISYPVNKPICAMYRNDKGGKIIVLGSFEMVSDSYIDKEENQKFMVSLDKFIEEWMRFSKIPMLLFP